MWKILEAHFNQLEIRCIKIRKGLKMDFSVQFFPFATRWTRKTKSSVCLYVYDEKLLYLLIYYGAFRNKEEVKMGIGCRCGNMRSFSCLFFFHMQRISIFAQRKITHKSITSVHLAHRSWWQWEKVATYTYTQQHMVHSIHITLAHRHTHYILKATVFYPSVQYDESLNTQENENFSLEGRVEFECANSWIYRSTMEDSLLSLGMRHIK